MNELLYYARLLLSDAELEALAEAGVSLFGPVGLRRYLAEHSFEAFCKLYFSNELTLDFPEIHRRIIADSQDVIDRLRARRPGRKIARALPRGHAKSSYFSRLLPLYCFLFDVSPLTVLLGNNDDSARRLVSNIKNTIESTPELLEDFPDIRGDYWGNEKLENSNASVITSFGVGSGSIRGVSTGKHRPALIILDDVDDDRSVRSAVELAHSREWLDKTVLPLGDTVTYTTSFIAVGTIIRKTSLMQYILDSPDFDSIIESAVKQFSDSPLWEQWKEQILDLARNNKQPRDASEDSFYQEHKLEMLAGTRMLWDRPDAYRQAMLYKLANERAFYSELQNQPQDTGGAFGKIEFVPLPTDDKDYDLLASLDPTEKGGKTNDLAAYIEVLFHKKRKQIIVSYVDAKQRSYSETINDIVQRIKRRGKQYKGLWVETNAAGGIIRDLLSERFNQEALSVLVNGIHNTQKKEERIDALSEYIARGQLLFTNNLAPELLHELDAWPLSQHDDVLDSLANLVLHLKSQGLLDYQLYEEPINGTRLIF